MDARSLLRTGALLVIGQVTVALVGIVALRLYTGFLSPAVFGASNLVVSALSLGLQLFAAGFVAAQIRFYSEAVRKGTADEYAREIMHGALRSTGAPVFLAVVIGVPLSLLHRFPYTTRVFAIGGLWLLAMTVRNVLISRIQAQRRQSLYAGLQVAEALLMLVITCGALHFWPTLDAFLLGQTLAIVCIVLGIVCIDPAARRALSFRRQMSRGSGFTQKSFAYGAPFAPLSLLAWLANLGDRYTLAVMLGAAAAGRYVAPFSLASRGMMLTNSALCDLFRPILFDAENRHDDAAAHTAFLRWIGVSIVVSLIGIVVVYLGGELIARVFLAPDYRAGAVTLMLWIAVGYAVQGVTQVIENRLMSLGYTGRLLLPVVLGAIANLAFSILLIRIHGILGAAEATCASFVFQNVATIGFLVHALSRKGARRALAA